MVLHTRGFSIFGAVLALVSLFTLSACKTTEPAGLYTARQVAVLQENGFTQEGDNWQLGIDDKLLFSSNENTLGGEQRDQLARLSGALVGVGIQGAEIQGHADSTGAAEYNRVLSQKRAEAVRLAMVTGGMPADRLKAIGYGEDRPLESNSTAAGRRENRRVVVLVTPSDVVPF